jgi:SPP1 family predicted phage head-tail adaptor
VRKHPVHLGELTEPIELHSLTSTGDGMGGSTRAWVKFADVFAHVRPLRGQERQGADRTEAISGFLVVIRHRDDIKESDSIRWQGRDLNVRFIHRRGPRELYLELECELGVRK